MKESEENSRKKKKGKRFGEGGVRGETLLPSNREGRGRGWKEGRRTLMPFSKFLNIFTIVIRKRLKLNFFFVFFYKKTIVFRIKLFVVTRKLTIW